MIKKKVADETVSTNSDRMESAQPEGVKKNTVARKRTTKEKTREKLNDAAQVHEQIAATIKGAASAIAQGLIDRAVGGDPAAAKYLFEFARIFPTTDETNAGTKEEDSLAKTLMHRLNLPEEPIKIDEDEDVKSVTSDACVHEGSVQPETAVDSFSKS
jgi:hypothetical protein